MKDKEMRNFLLFVLFLVASPVQSATITGMLYSTGSDLRVVGFDGTTFTSGFTQLQSLSPGWTGMSYDVAGSKLYYSIGTDLRVVGFDGATFTSGFTQLQSLSPGWTAMSLIFAPDGGGGGSGGGGGTVSPVPLPAGGLLLLSGLMALAFARRRGAHSE